MAEQCAAIADCGLVHAIGPACLFLAATHIVIRGDRVPLIGLFRVVADASHLLAKSAHNSATRHEGLAKGRQSQPLHCTDGAPITVSSTTMMNCVRQNTIFASEVAAGEAYISSTQVYQQYRISGYWFAKAPLRWHV